MKTKLFTKQEKEAIDTVLNMGFSIHNSFEDILRCDFGDYLISKNDGYSGEKEYSNVSSALTQFMKRESDAVNGISR